MPQSNPYLIVQRSDEMESWRLTLPEGFGEAKAAAPARRISTREAPHRRLLWMPRSNLHDLGGGLRRRRVP